MKKFILALDQGTTSSRAIVFDHSGSTVSMVQREFEQIYPQPGWVEHDPEDIWYSQAAVAAEAVTRAGADGLNIAGIGITNQRETTVVWDRKTNAPIYNAIVWQDRRTAAYCDELRNAGHGDKLRSKTGLFIDAYFSATKIRWILENVEGARERAERGELAFGTIDTWLVWKFTRGALHVTDVSNASRTMLFNIHEGCWDKELLELMGIPESMLPEVRSSSEIYGETVSTLFAHKVPIAGIAGDQQAALFGQMCTTPGMLKNTYGTGCFMMLNTGNKPIESNYNLLTTIAWKLGDEKIVYALEGSVFIGGAVVQWLRDSLGVISDSAEVTQLASTVEDNGGVYLVPAFAGLGAPHWDQYARGCIVGLTRGSTSAHIARAALESIAYQCYDLIEAMHHDSGIDIKELCVDGGACANDMLMQFQSDLMHLPIIRPKALETTALGAAYLAGLACGFWSSLDDVKSQWQMERKFEPAMPQEDIAVYLKQWRRALERSKNWIEE